MKNWLEVFKFTLKQQIKNKRFGRVTVIIALVFLIIGLLSDCLMAVMEKDTGSKAEEESSVTTVCMINSSDLPDPDTDIFMRDKGAKYRKLTFVSSNLDRDSIVNDPYIVEGFDPARGLVVEVTGNEGDYGLNVIMPASSSLDKSDARDLGYDLDKTIFDSRLDALGIDEKSANIIQSDVSVEIIKEEPAAVENTEDEDEKAKGALAEVLRSLLPMLLMLILYMMIILYNQSIGSLVSLEKTSKLMEYILTLTEAPAVIFGKVMAVAVSAAFQVTLWGACVVAGFVIGDPISRSLINPGYSNPAVMVAESLFGSVSHMVFPVILTFITFMAGFVFFCTLAALFASFAAEPEEVSQTVGLSTFVILIGFLADMYIPMISDAAIIKKILYFIPVTATFALPGDILTALVSPLEGIIFTLILIVWVVVFAIIAGRVYQNRVFANGTKNIGREMLREIGSAILAGKGGKSFSKEVAENEDKAHKAYTMLGLSLAVYLLITNYLAGQIAMVLGQMASARTGEGVMEALYSGDLIYVINIIAAYCIGFPVFLLMTRALPSCKKKNESLPFWKLAAFFFAAVSLTFIIAIFTNMAADYISGGEANNSWVQMISSGESLLGSIMAAFLGPVIEELIFRKVMIDKMRQYGSFTAIILSAVAFGLFHCNFFQIFYAAVIGLIFGYVYVRSGRIRYTIVMHILLNSMSVFIYPYSERLFDIVQKSCIVLGILSIFLLIFKGDIHLDKEDKELPAALGIRSAFISRGVLLFIAVSVLLTIYTFIQ
ncbi:CPBP family glutamic-type intramembrane protease [Butyrivibrio sp. MC2013]|uniref:CPBP family glutamic-type intramembrane protease n=1 Tax=Butyrivibrio sp. MC2013 TaxID=1280686 RepID=UPI00040077B1|nr:CPBP family glutamic-type intramembrane protease [Butyrivibrio sp. MC2013]